MKKHFEGNFYVLTVIVNLVFLTITLTFLSISQENKKTEVVQSFSNGRNLSSLSQYQNHKTKMEVAEKMEANILKAKLERLQKIKNSLENHIQVVPKKYGEQFELESTNIGPLPISVK